MIDKPTYHKDVIKHLDTPLRHELPNDMIVFQVKGVYFYKGVKLEDLTKEQLISVLRKVLKSETLK